MSKHKKTLQQKITADLRQEHFVYTFEAKNLTSANVETADAIPTYSYITRDILKTSILTLSIVVFQIILFLLLKNHVLKIPGINY